MTSCFQPQTELSSLGSYNQYLFTAIKPWLGKRVVDIGAGVGNLTHYLLDKDLVIAIDPDPSCHAKLLKMFSANKNIIVRQTGLNMNGFLDLKLFEPDTIMCINSLEHVKDDKAGITQMKQILTPGGHLALLVPAHDWLYGSLDVGHFRRYNKSSLESLLESQGFTIMRSFYINLLGIFYWWFFGRGG